MEGCFCNEAVVSFNKSVKLIELRQDKPTNFITDVGNLQDALINSDKIEVADFNGDGKSDLWIRKNGQVKIYGLDNDNNLQLLTTINHSIIQNNKDFLIGDYNGDGKSDFMVPQGNNSTSFRMFLSKGNSFYHLQHLQPFTYKQDTWNGTDLTSYIYIPTDINGDGKTDIVIYRSITKNGSTTGDQNIKAYKNIGIREVESNITKIRFSYVGEDNSSSDNLIHYPLPVFINSNKPNRNLELAIFSDSSIYSFDFNSDYRNASLIEKFTTFGNEYEVDYEKILDNNSNDIFPNFYSSSYDETYPYVNIQNAPSLNVVSEIRKDLESSTIKKIFFYNNAVFHNEGLGFLGFTGKVSTNWHVDVSDRIYTISEYDPHLRGALVKQYERDYFYSFNDDSENFISKRILQYTSIYDDDNFFILTLDSEHFEDNIKGTYLNTLYQYDDFYNIRRIDKINETGSTTTNIEYFNNNSLSNYYIGRKKKITNTSSINGETFTTSSHFEYLNNLLSKIKKYGNNTEADEETFAYDPYGNLKQHKVSPHNEGTRTLSYDYDNSGRFLEKSINEHGLETLFEYDYTTGLLLSSMDHLGNETSYEYDEWYRVKKLTDYLGNITTTSYNNLSNSYQTPVYNIVSISDDGSESESIYNHLGNIVLSKTKDISGDWVKVSYEYDNLGRPFRTSEPYKSENPSQWNETEYDFYGRPINQFLYTGKTISIDYNGLTTTVDDGIKTVSSTIDDFGRTISVTDPGGTINYEYYANGGLKSANSNGVIVQIGQDGWGRRTSLIDPSAGTYNYEYNGFGEITLEKTPKGETKYYYTNNGLLKNKIISGDNTEAKISYNYQNSTKFIKSISMLSQDGNNPLIEYSYDDFGRLEKIGEKTPYAKFYKKYSYDYLGRINKEYYNSVDILNNRNSSRTINYSYLNGYLHKVFDPSSNQDILEIDNVNERGQLTDAFIGANEKISRAYDEYGFLKNNILRNQSNSSLLMNLSTEFDAITGNLLNRTNSMFSWSEVFEYDDLDRLISSSDNHEIHTMNYDDYGRVTSNSHVGDFNYTNTSYQPDDIDLNIRGHIHYRKDNLQQISYNAFKKPHEIYNEDIERIGFQYNAFEQRSNMFYGSLEEEPLERRKRKHYSFDGSMEIMYDNETDETTFTTFVGGDAYTAPAIWKSVEGGDAEHDDSYYFLHRDYLGSIILITDGNGTALERRHFDAWGNIVKLTDGEGNVLEQLTITDRGYTGHEHLQDIGLIHMNGRLYDPNLKRMLSPDNYIQDMSNTQNYNRYAYVMNNPLKYVDPSGDFIEPVSASLLIWGGAALVGSAATFLEDATIGRWFNNAIGKLIVDGIDSALDWVEGLFSKKEKNRSISISNYQALNNDPMVGPSTRVQDSFFDGGGDIVGDLGVIGRNALDFTLARVASWQRGIDNTKSFLWNLVTFDSKTYGSIKDGFVTLSDPVLATLAFTNAYISVSSTIDRIPEMSPTELGGLFGDIEFFVAESLLFSKGVGATANGLKSLKYFRAANGSGNAFRYVSQGEIGAIKNTGLLRGGRVGETYFTKDLYKSGLKAQERLSLGSTPTHRIEFQILNRPSLLRNGTKVTPIPSQSGLGSEFMTLDPVRIRLINVQPLR